MMKSRLKWASPLLAMVLLCGIARADWDTDIDGRIDSPDDYEVTIVGSGFSAIGEMSDPDVFPYAKIEIYPADVYWQATGGPIVSTDAFSVVGSVFWGVNIPYDGWGSGRYLMRLKLYGTTVDEKRLYVDPDPGPGGMN